MTFTIPGDPVGKERPRVANGHAYTPAKTKAYEEKVKWCYKQQCPNLDMFPKGTPLTMIVVAGFSIPKSATKKDRAAMLNGTIRPTKVPDIDNICKLIMDSAQGIIYENDSSIVSIQAMKVYAKEPAVIVHFLEVDGANSPK